MLLNRFLEESAQRLPDKTALVCQAQRVSYAELNAQAERLAATLLRTGVRRQDSIGIYLENSVEAVVAVFGILKAGAVFSMHSAGAKAPALRAALDETRTRVLITDARRLAGLLEILPEMRELKQVIVVGSGLPAPAQTGPAWMPWEEALQQGRAPVAPRAAGIDMDLAAILYTSSTTGRAKGVMLSHSNMTSAAASVAAYLENTEQDILLSVLPMSFSYGLYQVLTAFLVGATVILEKPFVYPYPVIDTLVKEGVTGFPLVPAIAALLLQLKDLSRYDFSTVRYVTSAAQAIAPRQILGLQALFTRARFYSMYGQTECKRATYLPPEEVARRPSSVGKAIPNTETYLVDEAGARITVPNTVGELVVRGPHVMQGYWNLPEETARRLKPGFPPWEKHLYTGDLFKMDEEGFLYFVSRKDDLIKTGGELVSPKEVEDALYELPEVSEAAVKGRPDDILGQTLAAFVVLQEGSKLCEGDILAFCRGRLEAYKIPRTVRIMPGLPKTPSGKISKLDL